MSHPASSTMDRRGFLRVAGAGAAAAANVSAQSPARPNIVLIMADDMGFSDLGCYGSEIATPNLDRLGRKGVRFTQFYNTARCCPTRAALLTGLYNHQTGIGHMVQDRQIPGYRGFLNDRCVTIAEALRPAGYRTAITGKWHVGEERPHWPCDRGFDRSFSLISGASNFFRLDAGRKMAIGDQAYTPSPDFPYYMTDAFADHALRFLEEFRIAPQAQPFFLYLPFTSPHWPLHALEEDVAKYEGKYRKGWDVLRAERHRRMLELGIVDRRWPLTPRYSDAPAWESLDDAKRRDFDRRMAVYAAQIDRMDQNIGRLIRYLERTNQFDNTLILFLCDNGGCAEEVHRSAKGAVIGTAESYESYGLPWANASNTPFRFYKHWVHEGGIASPLVAHWPAGVKQPGSITHQPAHLIDIMATAVDVGGARYPSTHAGKPVQPLEGKSLLPILQGRQRQGHEAIFWEHEGNRAVRAGKWKLVSAFPGQWELYDLEGDRTELQDLSAREPERVSQMSAMYDAWAARCNVVPWAQIRGRG